MTPDNSWSSFFEHSLTHLSQRNLRRYRTITRQDSNQTIQRDGLALVNFGGNDYLGLRQHPEIIAAAIDACDGGVGSSASPAVTGYSAAQAQLEERLASFNKTQDALVFPSGFSGNLATISALVGEGDAIYSDALNHASLIDGCRLSKASRQIYPHNDTLALAKLLHATRHQHMRALIVTESIFSMDGDAAPLVELVDLANRFDCGLVVDEAHATGVYGSTGSGLLEELNLSEHVLCKLGTLSKAIGCLGGFVCSSHALVEHVLNFGRSYMFSTALPNSLLAAAAVSVDLITQSHPSRIALRQTSLALRQSLREQGWTVLGYDSPIIPIVLGDETRAMKVSEHLRSAGIFVPAIRPPTVPQGTSRLRISLSAMHTQAQTTQLETALQNCRENQLQL